VPLYDYQCGQCAHRFEVRQSYHDNALTECPQCGGRIRRVIHPVGIVFKGSGFYINDSRDSNNAKPKPAANGDGAAAEPSKTEADGSKDRAATPAASGEGTKSASGDAKSTNKTSSSTTSPSTTTTS